MTEDEKFMREAIKEALKAEGKEEVPIGCVIVSDGKIFSRAHNLRQTKRLATAHAEILAIEKACRKSGDWRLDNMVMYVTLEPCAMCVGAMIHARLKRVVFGAYDPKTGACGSVVDLFMQKELNHHTTVTGGILQDDCSAMLKAFFAERRKLAKAARQAE